MSCDAYGCCCSYCEKCREEFAYCKCEWWKQINKFLDLHEDTKDPILQEAIKFLEKVVP